MFVDKQKLERACLDEMTKIGNLFDTLKIKYCVFGEYALLASGIRTKHVPTGVILSDESAKEKILEMLFKMNYTIFSINPNVIKAKKASPNGDIRIDIFLGKFEGKNYVVKYNNKEMIFSKDIFNSDVKEIWGYFGRGKSGKGYFRIAPLEEIYFAKMNSDDEEDISDLEMIKGSGKLDLERLMKILKKNGLI
ncbi:MAG: hypothetical protein J7K73_00425 [Nanoarchaeota archaeon]|nr:hypothetical protein [Nanoarchaeota archaeon]